MDDTLDGAAATARKRQPSTRSTTLPGRKVRCISLRRHRGAPTRQAQCIRAHGRGRRAQRCVQLAAILSASGMVSTAPTWPLPATSYMLQVLNDRQNAWTAALRKQDRPRFRAPQLLAAPRKATSPRQEWRLRSCGSVFGLKWLCVPHWRRARQVGFVHIRGSLHSEHSSDCSVGYEST